MSFIGNVPAEAYSPVAKDTFSGNGSTTDFTLSIPATTNSVEVFVENVQQEPTDAYTISGTTLSFTAAPTSGTNNIYVIHRGPAVQTVVPPGDSITTAMIQDGAVTAAKIAAGAVETDKIEEGNSSVEVVDTGSGRIEFTTDGSERMRIHDSGEVLIGGTTSIYASSGNLLLQKSNINPAIGLFRNDTSVSGNNGLGSIQFFGNDTTSNTPTNLASIQGVADGTHSAGDNPTRLVFSVTPDSSSTVAEQMRLASNGDLRFNSGYGSAATAYGCRAWVNFNGTGTVAIRDDGNVSSIADNGTGDYTVNFTTAMPDANYAVVATIEANTDDRRGSAGVNIHQSSFPSASSFRLECRIGGRAGQDGGAFDFAFVCVSIFR